MCCIGVDLVLALIEFITENLEILEKAQRFMQSMQGTDLIFPDR
jgi:hypothetical protein